LTGKTLEVLYYFDQPLTISEIADWSDNCRNTVNRILKRFRDRGLVGADDSR
jgi:CRP-like cAMP-binding protein